MVIASRTPQPLIIPQNTMKRKMQGTMGLMASICAAASAFAGFAPWITALFAISAGLDCLTLGLFGDRDD